MHFPTYYTCMKLRETGFPQATLFCYCQFIDPGQDDPTHTHPEVMFLGDVPDKAFINCCAPILTELLEEIEKIGGASCGMDHWGAEWEIGYTDAVTGLHTELVEAAALLWLDLKGDK